MRLYATALTGMCSSIIAFDAMWTFTEYDAFEAFFLALLIGFVWAVAFLMVTDKVEEKRSKPDRAVFVKDEQTGIEYMPMRKGKVA